MRCHGVHSIQTASECSAELTRAYDEAENDNIGICLNSANPLAIPSDQQSHGKLR